MRNYRGGERRSVLSHS